MFGQRLQDLFALAGRDGTVALDAPKRSTPDPHWAWAPGYIALPFDPRTSPTITLVRVPEGLEGAWLPEDLSRFERTARGRVTGPEGPIPGALVWVARTWWTRTDAKGEFQAVVAPDRQKTEVIVLAPGLVPSLVRLAPANKKAPPIEIHLERRQK